MMDDASLEPMCMKIILGIIIMIYISFIKFDDICGTTTIHI